MTSYWGNQITGSELTILQSGSYTTSERVCCPPTFTYDGGQLTGAVQASLIADVALARSGPVVVSDGGMAAGDAYGEMVGYDHDGTAVPIRKHLTGGVAETNTHPAATRIRDLVNSKLKTQVP